MAKLPSLGDHNETTWGDDQDASWRKGRGEMSVRASSPSAKRARGEKTFDTIASPNPSGTCRDREVDYDYRGTKSARAIRLALHYMLAFMSIS